MSIAPAVTELTQEPKHTPSTPRGGRWWTAPFDFIRALRYYGYFRRHLYFYPRIASEMFLQKFTSKRRVLLAEIFFETRCNYNCWHCSSSEYTLDRNKHGLTLEELEKIVKKLRSVGVLSAAYVGGEPLVRKDLCDIIRMTNAHGLLPSIITNGSLLDEAKIDTLFDAGLANMGFSIQSVKPEEHDRLVNRPGAHAKIMACIQHCLDRRHTISVCAVPTNESLANSDFDAIVRFTEQHNIRLNVNLPAPIGRLFGERSHLLTPASLKQLEEHYYGRPGFLPDFKQTGVSRAVHCPMGENNMYILPDGEVCPCTFTHISFGNIVHEPIETILARMDASPTLRNLKRDGQCPIAMDPAFIDKIENAIGKTETYPPRAEGVGF